MRATQGLRKLLTRRSVLTLATLLPWLLPAGSVHGHEPGSPPQPTMTRLIPGRLGPSPVMRLPERQQADRDAAVADLTAALRTFTASLTEAQRQQLLFALDGPQRTTSRDPTLTPAFCAVLTWCVLGVSVYSMVAVLCNRQHLIGTLEHSFNSQAIDATETLAPGRSFADLAAL